MERDSRQEAFTSLLQQAEQQGYITFDNIMDYADAYTLSIQDFDWLTNSITMCGISIYDEPPVIKLTDVSDDEDRYEDFAQRDYEEIYNRIIKYDESLEPFVNEVKNIIPPQRKEVDRLKYLVVDGDSRARQRMIEMHLRIALKISLHRVETYDADIVETVSDACYGLITAVDRYEPEEHGAFGSYASMWILQNITRCQATRNPLIYFPVHKKETYFAAYPLLKQEGYIDNCIEDGDIDAVKNFLRENLSLEDEEVDDTLLAIRQAVSFEEMFSMFTKNTAYLQKHGGNMDNFYIEEYSDEFIFDANIDNNIMKEALRSQVIQVLETLGDRERDVIERRFGLVNGEEKTLEEVGNEFEVTRERIRQIEKKALRKLRHHKLTKYLAEFIDFI